MCEMACKSILNEIGQWEQRFRKYMHMCKYSNFEFEFSCDLKAGDLKAGDLKAGDLRTDQISVQIGSKSRTPLPLHSLTSSRASDVENTLLKYTQQH